MEEKHSTVLIDLIDFHWNSLNQGKLNFPQSGEIEFLPIRENWISLNQGNWIDIVDIIIGILWKFWTMFMCNT